MSFKIACLLFNGAVELDFIGPKDVFFASKWIKQNGDTVYTVAPTQAPITCLGGLKVIPDYSFSTAPQADILIVPGAADQTPQLENRQLLEWVRETSNGCLWITAVCSGASILIAAGPARGKRITTHWSEIEHLREQNQATVVDGVRYVRDGQLVTAAGVTSGIDMALWILGQLYTPEHARKVQHFLEYYPAPPYAAEV